MRLGCLLLLLTLLVPTTAYFRWVHVKGRLVCGCASSCNQSITHQDVRLMEYGWGMRDNQISAATSDGDGKFEISGGHSEYWGHNFFLEIRMPCWREGPGSFPACKNTVMQCYKKTCEFIVKVPIPEKYYYNDKESMKPVDLGNIEVVKLKGSDTENTSRFCPDM